MWPPPVAHGGGREGQAAGAGAGGSDERRRCNAGMKQTSAHSITGQTHRGLVCVGLSGLGALAERPAAKGRLGGAPGCQPAARAASVAVARGGQLVVLGAQRHVPAGGVAGGAALATPKSSPNPSTAASTVPSALSPPLPPACYPLQLGPSAASHDGHGVAAAHGAVGRLVNKHQLLHAALGPGGRAGCRAQTGCAWVGGWRGRVQAAVARAANPAARWTKAWPRLPDAHASAPCLPPCASPARKQQQRAPHGHHQAAAGGQLLNQLARQARRGSAHVDCIVGALCRGAGTTTQNMWRLGGQGDARLSTH